MARKPKSLAAQIDAMKRRWPGFEPTLGLEPQTVVWFGNLHGYERTFRVSVEFGNQMAGRAAMCRLMPVVRVLSPSLIMNFDATEEAPLPHVYFEGPNYTLSPLCLFDPKAGEWNRSMLIANTTIPWAVRWLAAYEIWEATGRWVGGGRHDDHKDANDAA